MSDSPFYNPNQAGVDEKIKAAISSLKSELQSFVSTEVAKALSTNNLQTPQPSGKTIPTKNNNESKPENFNPRESPQLNYVIQTCYNGEPRQLAISGQLIKKGKELNPIPPLEKSDDEESDDEESEE